MSGASASSTSYTITGRIVLAMNAGDVAYLVTMSTNANTFTFGNVNMKMIPIALQ